MKKLAYLMVFVVFLTGCQKQLTVEEQFDEIIKEAKDGTNESIFAIPNVEKHLFETSIYNGGDDYFTDSVLFGTEYFYNGDSYIYEDDSWEKSLISETITAEDAVEKFSYEAEQKIPNYQGIFDSLSASTDAKYENGVYYYNVQNYDYVDYDEYVDGEYVVFTYEELYLEIGKDYLFLKSKLKSQDDIDSSESFLSINPPKIPNPKKMEEFEPQKPSDKYDFFIKKI